MSDYGPGLYGTSAYGAQPYGGGESYLEAGATKDLETNDVVAQSTITVSLTKTSPLAPQIVSQSTVTVNLRSTFRTAGSVNAVSTFAAILLQEDYKRAIGVQLRVYNGDNPNELLDIFPVFKECSWQDVLSQTGSGRVTLSRQTMRADQLPLLLEQHIWSIYENNIWQFDFYAEEVIEKPVSEPEDWEVQISGRGVGMCLEWATKLPQGFPTHTKLTRTFTAKTRAEIFRTYLDEAQARGVIPFVTRKGWDHLVDSNGILWTDPTTEEISPGGDLLEMITDFGDQFWEWHMDQGFKLAVAAEIGRHRNYIRLYPGRHIKELQKGRGRREIKNVAIVEDREGWIQEFVDAPSVSSWRRRETYVKSDEAADEETREIIGTRTLTSLKDELYGFALSVTNYAPGARPGIDFFVGDWIPIVQDGVATEQRVVAISKKVEPTGKILCELQINTLFDEQQRRRERKLKEIADNNSTRDYMDESDRTEVYKLTHNGELGGTFSEPLTIDRDMNLTEVRVMLGQSSGAIDLQIRNNGFLIETCNVTQSPQTFSMSHPVVAATDPLTFQWIGGAVASDAEVTIRFEKALS